MSSSNPSPQGSETYAKEEVGITVRVRELNGTTETVSSRHSRTDVLMKTQRLWQHLHRFKTNLVSVPRGGNRHEVLIPNKKQPFAKEKLPFSSRVSLYNQATLKGRPIHSNR